MCLSMCVRLPQIPLLSLSVLLVLWLGLGGGTVATIEVEGDSSSGRRQHGRQRDSRQLREWSHPKYEGRNIRSDDDGNVKLLVTYRNSYGRDRALRNATEPIDFSRIQTIATTMPYEAAQELISDPNVLTIAEDQLLFAASEFVPYGVKMVQKPSSPPPTTISSCSDSRSVKVGIVDGGFTVHHPDSICNADSAACKGYSVFSTQAPWNNPVYEHGTHVGGIIGAVSRNSEGIKGVGDGKFCYLIARVLNDVGSGYWSGIMAGIQWAADNGASVINISIEGGRYVESVNQFFAQLYNDGILVVAAAGNGGSSAYTYPGAYPSVLAVAAIDANYQQAWFSQRHNRIDLAAPGVNVLSLAPLNRGYTIPMVSVGSQTWTGKLVSRDNAAFSLSLMLAECDTSTSATCTGMQGKICVMRR